MLSASSLELMLCGRDLADESLAKQGLCVGGCTYAG